MDPKVNKALSLIHEALNAISKIIDPDYETDRDEMEDLDNAIEELEELLE